MKDFNGKLAVVTGGASGVGFAIGEALAKEGAKVILTDVEEESLQKSTAMLTDQSLDVCCHVADVSDAILCTNLQVGVKVSMVLFICFLIMLV